MRTTPLWLHPWAYCAWLAISVVAYGTTYFSDPYVFAFTVLGMGTLSLGITLVGVSGAVFGLVTGAENRQCKTLLVLALLIGVASLTAFHVLKGFRWN